MVGSEGATGPLLQHSTTPFSDAVIQCPSIPPLIYMHDNRIVIVGDNLVHFPFSLMIVVVSV